MRMRKKHIRSVVERLLTSNRVSSAPVPIEDLARALGVNIRRTPAQESLSGFLLRDNGGGRAIIGVNTLHHQNRQRFTIAHELGHLLLHTGQEIYVDGRAEAGLTVSLRDEESSAGTNVEEIEANVFAAELLMPATFLHADFASYSTLDLLDEDTLGDVLGNLAQKYKVSRQALTYRLVNLGYAGP
jgi:Zn-dependent peptidase ImmA (M78 family)